MLCPQFGPKTLQLHIHSKPINKFETSSSKVFQLDSFSREEVHPTNSFTQLKYLTFIFCMENGYNHIQIIQIEYWDILILYCKEIDYIAKKLVCFCRRMLQGCRLGGCNDIPRSCVLDVRRMFFYRDSTKSKK